MSQEQSQEQGIEQSQEQMQEQHIDIMSWWSGISFDGKESFTLFEDGRLVLNAGENGKERLIAELTAENCAEQISSLGEKYYQLKGKVAELGTEWDATEDKMKLADKVSQLKHQLTHTPFIGNIDQLTAVLAPWEAVINEIQEAFYAARLKLAEQAEQLVESTEWKETSAALRDIVEQWKQSGHTDKHRSDKLWNRIEAARTAFMDRKQKHFEEQEKDLLINLDLKLDLVEQAESLVNSTEWRKTSETFHRLTNEWKTIGHTLNKKNEELWQRFIASKAAFFDRKRAHSEKIHVEQEQNQILKTALVEKAEALRDSTDWNATSVAMTGLLEEWKKTGRVNGEKGDELWAKFMAAQDQFFTAKKAHTDEIRATHEHNYNLKMELLRRAEQIRNSTNWSDTTAELNELLDEWKTIGPVAREHSNKIWEDFLAARKHFFARKDANRDQRKQHFENTKATRIVQAKEMVAKMLTDIKEEEEKLVDFRVALENITPGKKAEELKKHLEQLLTEGVQKIKRLKEKYDAIQNEYGKEEVAPATLQTEATTSESADEAATPSPDA